MAIVLRLISGIYLVLVWAIFVVVVFFMPGTSIETDHTLFRTFGTIPTHGMIVFLTFLIAVASGAPSQAASSVTSICAELQRPITGLMTTTKDDKIALERLEGYNKTAAQKLSGTSAAVEILQYDKSRAALVDAMNGFVQASERMITELQKCAR